LATIAAQDAAIAVMIGVTTEVVTAVATVAVADAVDALADVVVAAAAAVEVVQEDRNIRAVATCLLRNTLRHKVIVSLAVVVLKTAVVTTEATKIAAPTTVLPALPWRRCRTTISFCRASHWPSIAPGPLRLRSCP
jgi:hypothetical protein